MSKIQNNTRNICQCCCEKIGPLGIILHKTRRQTHSLCGDCGNGYLTPIIHQITENLRRGIRDITLNIKCPGTYHSAMRNRCKTKIDLRNITISQQSSLYTDIFRIVYVVEHPYTFLCPHKRCGDVVETYPGANPRMQCHNCHFTWCRNCQLSPYHEDMSCIEYEITEGETKTGKMLRDNINKGNIKLCPKCRTPTEKVRNNKGEFVACNKIICTQCNIKWCWLCQETDISYDHYNIKNKTRCVNKLWEGTDVG